MWSLRAWQTCGESAVSFWLKAEGYRVFRRAKGYTHVERYYVPTNPRTELQQEGRSMFRAAVASWQALSDEQKAAWNYYQDHRRKRPVMSGYNLFISKFLLSAGDPKIPPSGLRKDW